MLLTTLAYTAAGWISLNLNKPIGLASPLYPAAGVALAACLVYGRVSLIGVWLGSWLVNLAQGLEIGQPQLAWQIAPLMIAGGAPCKPLWVVSWCAAASRNRWC